MSTKVMITEMALAEMRKTMSEEEIEKLIAKTVKQPEESWETPKCLSCGEIKDRWDDFPTGKSVGLPGRFAVCRACCKKHGWHKLDLAKFIKTKDWNII